MTDDFEKIVYSDEVIAFTALAGKYCDMVDCVAAFSQRDFVDKSLRLLSILYVKALSLPQIEPIDTDLIEKTVTQEEWDEVQAMMGKILDHLEIPYEIGIGEAAFYGPKLDIQIKNVYGKEDTLITIQIDPYLAEKFDMEYVDRDGEKKHPFIIHRTSIGCYERTLALLIEKYAGAFPLWLAPTQIKLLAVADRHLDYAYEIKNKLEAEGFRVEVDSRSEKIGYKIREAQLEKVPYMFIVGDKDIEAGTVSVRHRKEGDLGAMQLSDFIALAKEEIETKAIK